MEANVPIKASLQFSLHTINVQEPFNSNVQLKSAVLMERSRVESAMLCRLFLAAGGRVTM